MSGETVAPPIAVEFTVHRMSFGSDPFQRHGAKDFGPFTFPVTLDHYGGMQYFPLFGADLPSDEVGIQIFDLTPVDMDGWHGGRMLLRLRGNDVGAQLPFLFFAGPSQAPTHTVFRHPYYGSFIVGLRSLASRHQVRRPGE